MCSSSCSRQDSCSKSPDTAVMVQGIRLGIAIALVTGLRLSQTPSPLMSDLRFRSRARVRRPRRADEHTNTPADVQGQ